MIPRPNYSSIFAYLVTGLVFVWIGVLHLRAYARGDHLAFFPFVWFVANVGALYTLILADHGWSKRTRVLSKLLLVGSICLQLVLYSPALR